MAFKFYARELEIYGKYNRYPYRMSVDQVARGVEAICEKYELPMPEIRFSGRKWHMCMWKINRLQFVPGRIYLRDLAHENAHYVRHKLYGDHRHSKELMTLIGEFIEFLLELFEL